MVSHVELDFTTTLHRHLYPPERQRQIDCEANAITLEDYIEEIWKKFETPPLSPERENELLQAADTLTRKTQEDSQPCDGLASCVAQLGSDPTFPILGQLLECEQMLALNEDSPSDVQSCTTIPAEFVDVDLDLKSNVTQSTLGQDCADLESSLLRDCMWNSQIYEPRNIYTPASSPPPSLAPSSSSSSSSGDEMEPVVEIVQPNNSTLVNHHHHHHPSAINTNVVSSKSEAVQMALRGVQSGKAKQFPYRSNPRTQPQAIVSESDEEIDVVTVVERPPRLNPSIRKRVVSVSAPCSRQNSPICSPIKSSKKRRYHTKRLQRLSSSGSNNNDGTESDDEQRRASHNVLERKRRNDLKYSFQVLRSQIPELEDNHRAPKVTILRKAADFIKLMQERELRMEEEFRREKLRKDQLMERMAKLRGIPVSAM